MKENKIVVVIQGVDWHAVSRLLALGFFILAFTIYCILKG